jgi:transcriptional regulator with XRE-family HTH domain
MDERMSIGDLLRNWRVRRRRSQLDLALDSGVSARHLSFVETGRASPSRDLLLRLAEVLDVPLREQNQLLLAGGFAPAYPARPANDDALAGAMAMVRRLLDAHLPSPALAIDRYWTLLLANAAVMPLLQNVSQTLLDGEINVLRLSLHPDGLAPRIGNFGEWRGHLLGRLRKQIDDSGDGRLVSLLRELEALPVQPGGRGKPEVPGIAVPLRLTTPAGELSFLSTTMVFGTPLDVQLSELAIETFLPADEETARVLRG